tara:strand:- start:195 stop:332 length:138 start_codon:yes stop_codon:yes gene_type:complete
MKKTIVMTSSYSPMEAHPLFTAMLMITFDKHGTVSDKQYDTHLIY